MTKASMFNIIHLKYLGSGVYRAHHTDYGPLNLTEVVEITTELNNDARDAKTIDRWIFVPAEFDIEEGLS